MMRKPMISLLGLLGLLSVFNLIGLAVSLSQSSRAATGGMKYEDLIRDPEFTRAVRSIAQDCKVNVDLAVLKC